MYVDVAEAEWSKKKPDTYAYFVTYPCAKNNKIIK